MMRKIGGKVFENSLNNFFENFLDFSWGFAGKAPTASFPPAIRFNNFGSKTLVKTIQNLFLWSNSCTFHENPFAKMQKTQTNKKH